jgi:anti-sigma regulatory factor (Ser/Thr protein kinase)
MHQLEESPCLDGLSTAEPLLEIRLRGGHDAPSCARQALGAVETQLADRCEDISLLVSELVTNAVVHAGADAIRLSVRSGEPREDIRVEVTAPGPVWELPAKPLPGPLGGFGFFFVDQLAKDWGVVSEEDETRVWFEIAPQ